MSFLTPQSLGTLEVGEVGFKLTNTIGGPLWIQDNDLWRWAGVFSFTLPIWVRVTALLNSNKRKRNLRSLAEDQFDIFNSIENTVTGMGFNGKSCLLRTVCEMQHQKIAKNSMLGQLFTTLMTPQKAMTDHLHDYVEAEEFGKNNKTSTSCSEMYPECPVSLFNMFRKPPDAPQRSDNAL